MTFFFFLFLPEYDTNELHSPFFFFNWVVFGSLITRSLLSAFQSSKVPSAWLISSADGILELSGQNLPIYSMHYTFPVQKRRLGQQQGNTRLQQDQNPVGQTTSPAFHVQHLRLGGHHSSYKPIPKAQEPHAWVYLFFKFFNYIFILLLLYLW